MSANTLNSMQAAQWPATLTLTDLTGPRGTGLQFQLLGGGVLKWKDCKFKACLGYIVIRLVLSQVW